jgi:hypothetical protein
MIGMALERRCGTARAGLLAWCLAWLGCAQAQDFPPEAAPPPNPNPSLVVPTPPRPRPPPAVVPEPVVEPAPVAAIIEDFGPPELVGPPVELANHGDGADTRGNGERVLGPLSLLGQSIAPGTRAELPFKVGESFDGSGITTPVTIVHGALPGPRLCLTAAVHGDELNGIEVVRRVVNDAQPEELSGTLIAVPIVNLLGFSRGSRYLPDRRDLNRYFPGTNYGSSASRLAYTLFRQVVVHCDALVDFHTGSFDRANLPQVRGDLTIPSVLELTRGFGAAPVLHSPGARGMMRLAASDRGIPAVTFEVGAPARLEPEAIDFAVQSISSLMHRLGMTRSFRMWSEPQATFYESKWVRADSGGMLFSSVKLGDRVRQGQQLGKVIDPIQNEERAIVSPLRGRVLGMALNQVVLPGFAAYHIGVETSEEEAVEDAAHPVEPGAIEQLEGDELNEGEAPAGSERSHDNSAPPSAEG